MRYAFLTDIHLDCLTHEKLNDFLVTCADPSIDGYLISGDIGTGPNICNFLRVMQDAWQKPILFCLGNHDFWHSAVSTVSTNVRVLARESELDPPSLTYVSAQSFVTLTPETALVGHDGWYDGLHGDARNSRFLMNDWWNIKEFKDVLEPLSTIQYKKGPRLDMPSRMKIIELCQRLASEAASHVRNGINVALAQGKYKNIVILTHVPPWQEAHIHEGRPGGDQAAPWFTSKIMGDMLEGAAKKYPDVEFTVLCGHTHGRTDVQISQNLTCRVGGADYIKPEIQFVVDV
jgi:predicted MPP superfamily phosphohydrolase